MLFLKKVRLTLAGYLWLHAYHKS